MTYRDLGGEDATKAREVADQIGDPASVGSSAPAPDTADAGDHPSRAPLYIGALLTVAAALVGVRIHQAATVGPPPAPAAFPTLATTHPAAPVTGAPAAPQTSTRTTTPGDPAPTGAPEPPTIADGGQAALTAVQAFLPAWTLHAGTVQRRVALQAVASAALVDELAFVDPAVLPTVTGPPSVLAASPPRVQVAVPTSAGTALLTVQPTTGRWLVTAVSLQQPQAPAGA